MPENRHIIVIDDDTDVRNLIVEYFSSQGYRLTCFADAESALKVSAEHGAEWNVVLCDLKLPRMSGVEFSQQIKKSFPHLPIILITTTKNAEIAVDAIKNGAYDFIVKPIHFPQLQISVERGLHFRELNRDLSELKTRVRSGTLQNKIIGRSPKFLAALDVARRVAKSKANIFISGESGTGKEVFARYIHLESDRAKGPFIPINCSAIPENLLESELFGHAKGAFTGAQDKKTGLFEEAENGTLFLDEIGDLPGSLQAKLLRVLQEKKIKRVGENQYRAINCRIISATHKDLLQEIRLGRFREDLFFRLNVIPISIPPLRDRPEDLLPLAESFLRKFALENDSPARVFSKECVRFILENRWQGNVRELENSIERAVVLASESEVPLKDMLVLYSVSDNGQTEIGTTSDPARRASGGEVFAVDCASGLPAVDEIVNRFIEFAVNKNNGARDRTAKEIGIDRKTLYKRLRASPELSL